MDIKSEYFPRIVKTESGFEVYPKDLTEGLEHIYFEDLAGVIQCEILSFCGCGNPKRNLSYILTTLQLLTKKSNVFKDINYFSLSKEERNKADETLKSINDELKEYFKTSEAEYFMYYWLDSMRFTEHGGSVPGWVTEKGAELLNLLILWKEEEEEKTSTDQSINNIPLPMYYDPRTKATLSSSDLAEIIKKLEDND